tara:strand:- start:2151 stop:2450 length:300 start_codon:yes stop_codon:yes gene_type:complete
MKKISEIIPFSDAHKQLEKRKRDTTMTEDVVSMKTLAEEIYEVRAKKYFKPLWFEIQKEDNPEIWESHLQTLGVESDCNAVTLKVVAYVEHEPLHDAPC